MFFFLNAFLFIIIPGTIRFSIDAMVKNNGVNSTDEETAATVAFVSYEGKKMKDVSLVTTTLNAGMFFKINPVITAANPKSTAVMYPVN